MIAFVWAESTDGTIGNNGGLPWKIPADMQHFKAVTINHDILAGRATFLSFGRPLPQRTNMILTTHPATEFPAETVVFNDIQSFLNHYRQVNHDVYVVGGAKVFQELLPFVDVLYRTIINANIDGDTKMPAIDYHQYERISQEVYPADEKNQFSYVFETYRSKAN